MSDEPRFRLRPATLVLRTAILTFSVAGLLALSGGQAVASPVSCGDTIMTDTKLEADLTNCPGVGIVIGAEDITLDLNGHTIDGVNPPTTDCNRPPGTTIGVSDEGGFDDITVRNGTIQEFDHGIEGGLGDSRLTHLTLRANTFSGISIGSFDPQDNLDDNTIDHNIVDGDSCGGGIAVTVSHGSVIEHNRVTNMHDEEGAGIILVTGGDNRVEHNSLNGIRGDGVALYFDTNQNRIEHNTISDGGGGIVILGPASNNRIQHNAIARMQFAGIVVEMADFAPGPPTGNEIARNTLVSTADGIILFEAEAAEVTRNSVTGSGTFGDPTSAGFGIILDGVSHSLVSRNSVFGARGPAISVGAAPDENPSGLTPTGNVVSRNASNRGDADGIRVVAVAKDTWLEGNTADGNGADGIHVHSPNTTLTRNTANFNAYLGIEAAPGVIDGGGNTASGNGNPLQCVNVVCKAKPDREHGDGHKHKGRREHHEGRGHQNGRKHQDERKHQGGRKHH
jgi:parallel beta-helix repeat protein